MPSFVLLQQKTATPSSAPPGCAGMTTRSVLSINQPGDGYEQEADRLAERVMRMTAPAAPAAMRPRTRIGVQRACACGGTCNRCTADSTTAPPIVNEVLSSSARPLDAATRAFMEPRFGYDFAKVRVHDDAKAAASAKAMNARAYTVGHHVVFSGRSPRPGDGAADHLMAHELAHVMQQQSASPGASMVMRAPDGPAKTQAPAAQPPAPCTFNCTDPAFAALSTPDREKSFAQTCPQGYPPDTTFFGQAIPAATSPKLRGKLLAAAARAKRLMCGAAKDPTAYQLDRRVKTYAAHSPSEARAVDIDYEGQTYLLHEHGVHKTQVESQLSPVYNRIAFWSLGTKSIIPHAINTVSEVPKGSPDARTWTNPDTGQSEGITTGELYDKLSAESTSMTQYFELLTKDDADLQKQIQQFVDQHQADADAAKKLDLPFNSAGIDLDKFRKRVANDYRLLGGSKAQLKDFAGKAIADASKAPPSIKEDGKDIELSRPFRGGTVAGSTSAGAPDPAANRRPELGFLTLPREVVVALTQEGLVWGAIDFGGESGDVMHFDCRRGDSGC